VLKFGYGRRQSWPNLWNYLGLCPEGLRKDTKIFSQDSRFLGLKPEAQKYKIGILTTWQ
jgi:hypothetical protein